MLDVQAERRTDREFGVTHDPKERLWVDVVKQEGKQTGHSI